MSIDPTKLGRFDQSFIVRMIMDFFLILVLVVVVELGVRFAIVVYDFYTAKREDTEIAARGLASDVREIMMNQGGPVAARTVYPILKENHDRMGLEIAIVPSAVTADSIEERFGFAPRGVQPDWPKGRHHAVSVDIEADRFCLQCHTEARVGDTLGHVTVRNYLSTHLAQWWEEVRLTGLMSMLKIMLHTTVLFFLLRLRMSPLLTLRAVVSDFAKGGSDLSRRAPVKSSDEFGELAADLNRFLDRINDIVDDLTNVLERVSELNHRLEGIQTRLEQSASAMEARIAATRSGLDEAVPADPLLGEDWRESVRMLREVLERLARDHPLAGELARHFDDVVARLEEAAGRSRRLREAQSETGAALEALDTEFREFHRAVGEIRALEELMETIAGSGQALVGRLRHSDKESDDDTAEGDESAASPR